MLGPGALQALGAAALNIASATGIVFANKAVFSIFNFSFTYALTFIHTIVTWIGMQGFLQAGLFEPKIVPKSRLAPLAAAYVGYIVLCNLNLNINQVGFYQITKIAVAPAVLGIEFVYYGKRASPKIMAAVALVCLGVGLATITDPQISSNLAGLAVGFGSVAATALYQIWAGVKQKELSLGSMQLLHQYVPLAALFLGVLVPLFEPMGWSNPTPHTVLGYQFTPGSVMAIAISAMLGLLVNLSTFLVIGATSSLTYNVVGHVKTVLILTGGVLFFGDTMPAKKLGGIMVAMLGIVWYSQIKLSESAAAKAAAAASGNSKLQLPSNVVHLSGELNGSSGGGLPDAMAHISVGGQRSPKAQAAKSLGSTLRGFQPTIRELTQVSAELKSTLENEIGINEIKEELRRPVTPTHAAEPAAAEGAQAATPTPLSDLASDMAAKVQDTREEMARVVDPDIERKRQEAAKAALGAAAAAPADSGAAKAAAHAAAAPAAPQLEGLSIEQLEAELQRRKAATTAAGQLPKQLRADE